MVLVNQNHLTLNHLKILGELIKAKAKVLLDCIRQIDDTVRQ
jgi:hypothetical protein